AVTLNSSIDITTGAALAGDITFTNDSSIDAQATESNDLTLTAGTGAVLFNEDIGATNSIGALTITRADGGVVFGQADNETAGAGTTGPVNTVATDDAINIGSTTVIAGGIVLNGGAAGTIAFITTDDDVRFNGAVTLQTDATIDTGNNAGDITFTSDSTIDSEDGTADAPLGTTIERHDLFLDAGDGTVTFNANIGDTQRLDTLTVDRAAGGVIFGAADTAATGAAGPVTSVATDGAIDIGSGTTADDVITGGIVLNGATTGITFQTSSDTIRFNGPVTLNSDVTLDTDEDDADTTLEGADVTFTVGSTIDSQSSEANTLIIDAGVANVLFNGNIGAAADGELGALQIAEADGGVVFGETDGNVGSGTTGPVTTIELVGDGVATHALDIGVGNLDGDEISGGITFNAGPTAADTLTIATDGQNVRLNGPVTINSDLTITTNGFDGAGNNLGTAGDIFFSDVATIDSQATEVNDLVFRAGSGDITFNGDIGTAANGRPGTFTVEDSTANLTFGGADAAAINSDTAPVSTINLDGAMNLGAASTELTSIVFNGGPGVGDTLVIDTTGDDVRINGAVTLNSSIDITTGAALAGDITFTNDLLSETNETLNLTLTAGTGDIVFDGIVGTTVLRFDDITIVSARDVTARQAVKTTTFVQTNGTGTTTFDGTLNTSDLIQAGIDINTSSITFNGAVTTTGDGRVFLTNQGDTLTIAAGATFDVNNTFIQDGTGDVVVNANITTANDEIRFSPTTDPTADVQAAASITLADGTVLATGGNADIRLRAEGDIRLSRLVTSSVDGLISVQSDSGAIIDNGDTGGADIVSHDIALRAATGIGDDGLADPALNVVAADLPSAIDPKVEASAIDTEVSVLAASNSTSGDIQVSNTVGGLLTIGTVDGLSGVTNDDDNATDDTVADGPNGGVIWITNASPIDVSSQSAPNDAEGVRNSAGGSVILTAVENAGPGDDLQIFAPVEAMRGTGSLLLNAGDDLTVASPLLTAIGSGVTLRDRAGNIDLNAGNVLSIGNNTEVFDIQTGSLLENGTVGADTSVISQAQRETDFQTNRQIRYTQGSDPTDLVLESGALLATNIVHQVDPSTGTVVDNRILSNSGVLADFGPLLVEETFATMQVRSDGYATIAGRFGRALDSAATGGLDSEVNFRLLVAWGDDSFSFHHLTGTTGNALPEIVNATAGTLATGEMILDPEDDPMGVTTSRTFFFEHFYNGDNLPDPDNPGSPIQIRVFMQGDPNIVQVDSLDTIVAYINSTDLLAGETPDPDSFLANDDQFLISELLSPDLDTANLGEFGTGLSARVDSYRAPGEQIAGVRNPAFNTIKPNPFGTSGNLTDGLPAIVDFQFEEAAITAFDLDVAAQPNSTDASVTADVPGDGVDSAAVAVVFDLSAEVTTLDFPKTAEALDAFVITVTQKDDSAGATGQTRQSEEAAATERIVWLKVLRPTGQNVAEVPAIIADDRVYSPLPGGGFRVLRVVEEVPLDEEVLDNLPKLIFEKLPDGQYQIWLQEPGEQDKRFVMDVTIRDGRPVDDKAGARDRPPTSLKKAPVQAPAAEDGTQKGSAKETTENSGNTTGRKVSALGSGRTSITSELDEQSSGVDQAWSQWGQRFGTSQGEDSSRVNVMSELRGNEHGDESEFEVAAKAGASNDSQAMIHPVVASAILAAGSVVSKRKQTSWKNRVDDTMAQWDKLKLGKKR
ncbi:MAG: beta strand repeat-containing protein, partial [Planctomycetales bacterium]